MCADVAGDLLNRTEARDLKRQALRSDHVVDALASALVALMVDEKLVEPIPDGMEDAAEREGWIALPTGSLEKLAKKFSGS